MAFSLKTHEFRRVSGSNTRVLTRIRPYIRVRNGEDPPLYIQEGRVYSESGQEVDPLPPWFWDHARTITPAGRNKVGLVLPEEKKVVSQQATTSLKKG